ncbi:hypothetical protein X805_36680 [Sphaerotilus natans subsp. natans DSM 6575]|uniref:Uncharacterized protein n=1 Tax=Sphaerotilus natans subsp. natans DSM 6575 TaxID=1286631 RepID=A0A059KHA8_9BURK|nr:hypothetical protein X805_36680 [Sphaerotilus natans subsp. natans DSM 6575]
MLTCFRSGSIIRDSSGLRACLAVRGAIWFRPKRRTSMETSGGCDGPKTDRERWPSGAVSAG